MRELHPDSRDPAIPALEADAALRLVTSAWEVLGDPARRADYDRARGRGAAAWEPAVQNARFAGPVRVPWWLVAIAIMVVIFVFTAYAATPRAGP